ncbi:MAG: hypothetical protein R3350_09405, partial [Saprospiraceae bacterium]|nr:hypothetical protein [Saprospiraceae bacterium]
MPLEKTDIKDLHFEHTIWRNELKFFKQEVSIFEKQLEKLVKETPAKDAMAQLEQFQNNFIRQKEVIDELSHHIKVHEREISEREESNGGVFEDDIDQHLEMRDRMITFRKIYNELKNDFFQFLTK